MKSYSEFLKENNNKWSQQYLIGKALKMKSFDKVSDYDIKRLAKLVKREYELENQPKPIKNPDKYTTELLDIDKKVHQINSKYKPNLNDWVTFKKATISGQYDKLLQAVKD